MKFHKHKNRRARIRARQRCNFKRIYIPSFNELIIKVFNKHRQNLADNIVENNLLLNKLNDPPEPNHKLKAAAKRYKEITGK